MTLEDWLEPRLQGAPTELATAVRKLVREAGDADPMGASIPERLASSALVGLDGVAADDAPNPRSRHSALRLLAADAALTYAFEAAADLGADPGALADRLGPHGALGERLIAARDGSP